MSTPTGSPDATPSRGRKLARRLPWYRRMIRDVAFVSKRDRKFWLLPLIGILLLLALLLAVAAGTGPLAPFIYPLL